jgi:hypothetical protein
MWPFFARFRRGSHARRPRSRGHGILCPAQRDPDVVGRSVLGDVRERLASHRLKRDPLRVGLDANLADGVKLDLRGRPAFELDDLVVDRVDQRQNVTPHLSAVISAHRSLSTRPRSAPSCSMPASICAWSPSSRVNWSRRRRSPRLTMPPGSASGRRERRAPDARADASMTRRGPARALPALGPAGLTTSGSPARRGPLAAAIARPACCLAHAPNPRERSLAVAPILYENRDPCA